MKGIVIIRGGKIGPARWASPVHPELGQGWAIKLLTQKKPGQIWSGNGMAQPGPARPNFFAFKRLFGPTSPIFRTGWDTKILARNIRANFGPARFWPSPVRLVRLPALVIIHYLIERYYFLSEWKLDFISYMTPI